MSGHEFRCVAVYQLPPLQLQIDYKKKIIIKKIKNYFPKLEQMAS